MKKIIISLFALSCILFAACSDDETIIEFENVTGISIKNIEDNLISILEYDGYKVEIEVHPETAKNIDEFTKFIFTSSDESVFTVDKDGNIKAIAIGEAVLTVKADSDPSIMVKCMVKVNLKVFPVETIEVSDEITKAIHFTGAQIDLGAAITVLPDNATYKDMKYKSSDETVATVTKEGVVKSLKEGKVTITIETIDDSGVFKDVELNFVSEDLEIDFTPIDRTGWEVKISHDSIPDKNILGTPEALLDGEIGTGLSLMKEMFGKEPIYFTIETAGIEFNAFELVHRKHQAYLAVQGVDVLGSNDGENFEAIARNVPVSYKTANSVDVTKTRVILKEGETAKYKYIRIEYSNLDMSGGKTAQVMEINFGIGTFK